MNKFSRISLEKLSTCDIRLKSLMYRVLVFMDITILEGHRSLERQGELVTEGRSKVNISKHNTFPSLAVDIAPYPIPKDWNEKDFIYMAGIVMGIADSMGLKIRWGGDWNQNKRVSDNKFNDYVHFELIE